VPILALLQRCSAVKLWLYAVAGAIVLTEIIVSGMGLLLLGEITADYLLTGLVASFLAASLISAIILYFLAEMRRLNAGLQQRVNEEVAKSRAKDHLLIVQARHAALGELISNIAHHWRQPLNALGLLIANVKDAFDHGELDDAMLTQAEQDAQRIIRGMSETIDRFRALTLSERDRRVFDAGNAVREAIAAMGADLKQQRIAVDFPPAPPAPVLGYPVEFTQAVLHILNNAREILAARRVADPRIALRLERNGNNGQLTIGDNAGGIPADILPRIFDPYFTTKERGPGVGLYLAKSILENGLGGQLSVRNGDAGAEFLLAFPLAEDA
jgi:signal transduction histidine kinase